LSNHPLHFPRAYGGVRINDAEYLLLENGAIYPSGAVDEVGSPLSGCLMPALIQHWQQATLLRRLNWFSQVIGLWSDLAKCQARTSVLDFNLMRVDGDVVRFLELKSDRKTQPSLKEIGECWYTQFQPEGQDEFWANLWQRMIHEEIKEFDQLIHFLDHTVHQEFQTRHYQLSLATLSDAGPNREHNEDACYPRSGTQRHASETDPTWWVVCDGIGGHEGGDLASNQAITTIVQQLEGLKIFSEDTASSSSPEQEPHGSAQYPGSIVETLHQAVEIANDVICEQNNLQGRLERQRIGTTLVLGLVNRGCFYLTHIGDSRAYRITPTGCHQMTADDDLATREAQLGHVFYRQVLQYSGTGALTQALGMHPSDWLHFRSQRLILDQECIILFCSDGLSDFDLLEEFWATTVLPVLQGQQTLAAAVQQLVDIANVRNGHDNVTVALLHYQPVAALAQDGADPVLQGQRLALNVPGPVTVSPQLASRLPTQIAQPVPSRRLTRFLPVALVLGLVGGAIAAAYWLRSPSPVPVATVSPSDRAAPQQTVAINQILRVGQVAKPLPLLAQPGQGPAGSEPASAGSLAADTIVQVVGYLSNPQGAWVRVTVCSTPATQLKLGNAGWLLESSLLEHSTAPTSLPEKQMGPCVPSSPIPPLQPSTPPG
jgi:serine/threonine protein phosphatase PrpC